VPGMRVDVIVSGRTSDSSQNNVVARTALQNIEVLSAGQKIEKTADGKPQDAQVVNLLVTPDQAEVLSLASNETKIQLVLRNPMDTQEETTHGASMAALFGLHVNAGSPATLPEKPRAVRAPAAPKPQPPPATVEVFSGVKKSEQTLESQ
jgi:pilus assembly protein CpaB